MSQAERAGRAPGSPLLIANSSGFFGDRISAAREMVDGGPIDVLTGDWLAELTMAILHKTRARSGGYAGTFLRQMEDVLGTCLERGIKVVSNAGGLDPPAAAQAVRDIASRLGLEVRVASVAGDDITSRIGTLQAAGERFLNLDTGEVLGADAPVITANAYLGGAPIAAALEAGADVVVTGRVTDAALVTGPGIWAFGWGPDDLDALAGSVVAGHVIECGTQCCGGNFAFFEDIPGMARVGFPLAELAADGSAVITKHPGTGGAVTIATVTAQLLYEIGGPRYLGPDVVTRFDTIALEDVGPDRVRISGTRGEPPPSSLKVAANLAGGWRNSVTLVVSGGRAQAKVDVASSAIWQAVPGGREAFTEVAEDLIGGGGESGTGVDTAFYRVAVRGDDEALVGRAFSDAVISTTLAGYPGTFATAAPGRAQEVARYWPTTVIREAVVAEVLFNGAPLDLPAAWHVSQAAATDDVLVEVPTLDTTGPAGNAHDETLVSVALGVLVGARSGDKGGHANIGLWADTDEVFAWLLAFLDEERVSLLLPETASYQMERHVLSNLRAVNVVIRGILGWGAASNLLLDSQGKGLAERILAQPVEVPISLVSSGPPAGRRQRWS